MKKKNRGFSLVEILIAVSVFSVLVGMTGISLSVIKRSNFKKAAEKLQRAVVTARTESMAKGTTKGAICFNTRADGSVYVAYTDGSNSMICNSSVTVSYFPKYNNANGVASVTGQILQFKTSGTVIDPINATADNGGKFYLESNDGLLKAEVVIYPVTGKTTLRYL